MGTYRRLPTSPGSPSSDAGSVDDLHHFHEPEGRGKKLATLARNAILALCLFCTIINVLVLVLDHTSQATGPAPDPFTNVLSTLRHEDITHLRRPSQFIHFEDIQRSSPPIPRQLKNHPILISQVDSSDPDRVFGEVKHRYMTHSGTITPEGRRVLVTQSISTIIQFRAFDYGMGICELRLTIPPSIMHGNDSGSFDGTQSRPLSIYRLNSTAPLIARKLSASSKPERVARLVDVLLQPKEGIVWYKTFTCEENEILTFELACGSVAMGDTCDVEWWQDKEDPNPAVFFMQYSTI